MNKRKGMCEGRKGRRYVHGRSGSVALPRTKVVPARPARETAGAEAREAARRTDVRRILEFMVGGGCAVAGIGCWTAGLRVL